MSSLEPRLPAVLKREYRAAVRFGAALALPAPSAVARPLQL
jgi:hypothetical protein